MLLNKFRFPESWLIEQLEINQKFLFSIVKLSTQQADNGWKLPPQLQDHIVFQTTQKT